LRGEKAFRAGIFELLLPSIVAVEEWNNFSRCRLPRFLLALMQVSLDTPSLSSRGGDREDAFVVSGTGGGNGRGVRRKNRLTIDAAVVGPTGGAGLPSNGKPLLPLRLFKDSQRPIPRARSTTVRGRCRRYLPFRMSLRCRADHDDGEASLSSRFFGFAEGVGATGTTAGEREA